MCADRPSLSFGCHFARDARRAADTRKSLSFGSYILFLSFPPLLLLFFLFSVPYSLPRQAAAAAFGFKWSPIATKTESTEDDRNYRERSARCSRNGWQLLRGGSHGRRGNSSNETAACHCSVLSRILRRSFGDSHRFFRRSLRQREIASRISMNELRG